MGETEFQIGDGDLVRLIIITLVVLVVSALGFVFLCKIYALFARSCSSNVEVEDTEVENDVIEETEIGIDPNSPPPDYNEIDHDSTTVQKRNFDEISINSLPAYEDIWKTCCYWDWT